MERPDGLGVVVERDGTALALGVAGALAAASLVRRGSPASASDDRWRAWARGRVRRSMAASAYQAEYDRLLPAMRRAHRDASSSKAAMIEALDRAFHEGDREGLIAWVRTLEPTAFEHIRPKGVVEPLPLPRAPGEEALEPLPDWASTGPVYHGTRALTALLTEGLCAPGAIYASADADYGWEGTWRAEVYRSWRHQLDEGQRRRFRELHGLRGNISADLLGEHVALFWVTRSEGLASGWSADHFDGGMVQIDLSKLRYYWWFPDAVMGEASTVFVLPRGCPQALPSAFHVVYGPDGVHP